MFHRLKTGLLIFLLTLLVSPLRAGTDQSSLTIMSTRKPEIIEPVIQAYSKKYGIKINYQTVSSQKMLDNFVNPMDHRVDVYLAKDMTTLHEGERTGAFREVSSKILEQNVPERLRCEENFWFASTTRARAIIYNPDKVNASQLLSYAALATPFWNNRLCLRDGHNEYNRFLVSALIHHYGRDNTLKILQGWKNNLATNLTNSDSDAIRKVAVGVCDVTIANHYYFTRLKNQHPDMSVAIFWPDQKAQGAHVGLSGYAIAKDSKNPDQALAFIEWLSSEAGQKVITDHSDEFPVNPRVSQSKAAALLGSFKKESLTLEDLVDNSDTARELIDKVGLHL